MAVLMIRNRELVTQHDARILGAPNKARRKPKGATTPFEPIGLNKPLALRIAHVYTGRFPVDSLFGRGKQDMLLTSAIKGHSVYASAPRAINYYAKGISKGRSLIAPAATETGTALVFYSPAVTDASLTLTLDLAFDSFPDTLIRQIGAGFESASGFPIFAPFAGYLQVGSQLVKLAADVGRAFFEGQPEFTRTETLEFDLPGYDQAEANFRIISNPSFDFSGLEFSPKKGLVLKSSPTKIYDGDEPYIVISLDGRADQRLEAFTPMIASAELLNRVLGAANKAEAAIDGIVEAAKLSSDARFRIEADQVERRAAALLKSGGDPAQIAALTARRESLIRNIQSDLLKPPSTNEAEPAVLDPTHDAAALPRGKRAPARRVSRSMKASRAAASTSWRVARSLMTLREQINAIFPDRNKASDGTIGDAAHASQSSDHNPWVSAGGLGVVTAMDITHDPAHGCDAARIVDALVRSRDPRIKYIISNSKIINASSVGSTAAWTPRAYTGSNKHDKHFHISVASDAARFDDAAPWAVV
ncbi:MAG: hypothetical protein ABI556_07015 [Gemmatimonadales bacterium]